jgi:hypothetical protein
MTWAYRNDAFLLQPANLEQMQLPGQARALDSLHGSDSHVTTESVPASLPGRSD